tara:strand:- start:253 stop:483 length:231 start_codon:yes stop_codon:yes gene_type:complete
MVTFNGDSFSTWVDDISEILWTDYRYQIRELLIENPKMYNRIHDAWEKAFEGNVQPEYAAKYLYEKLRKEQSKWSG